MIILGIGGRIIKENYDDVKKIADKKLVDIIICNGSVPFHDFQRTTENLKSHSIPLADLLDDYTLDEKSSRLVWEWIYNNEVPKGSLVDICNSRGIKVLLFASLGTDFWQLFPHVMPKDDWKLVSEKTYENFSLLVEIMKNPFTFICMGSEAHLPEVFVKALALSKQKEFNSISIDPEGKCYRLTTRFKEHRVMPFKDYFEQMMEIK